MTPVAALTSSGPKAACVLILFGKLLTGRYIVVPSDAYGLSTPPSALGRIVYGGFLTGGFPVVLWMVLMPSLSWPLWTPTGVFHSSLPVCASLAIAIPALPAERIVSFPLTVVVRG